MASSFSNTNVKSKIEMLNKTLQDMNNIKVLKREKSPLKRNDVHKVFSQSGCDMWTTRPTSPKQDSRPSSSIPCDKKAIPSLSPRKRKSLIPIPQKCKFGVLKKSKSDLPEQKPSIIRTISGHELLLTPSVEIRPNQMNEIVALESLLTEAIISPKEDTDEFVTCRYRPMIHDDSHEYDSSFSDCEYESKNHCRITQSFIDSRTRSSSPIVRRCSHQLIAKSKILNRPIRNAQMVKKDLNDEQSMLFLNESSDSSLGRNEVELEDETLLDSCNFGDVDNLDLEVLLAETEEYTSATNITTNLNLDEILEEEKYIIENDVFVYSDSFTELLKEANLDLQTNSDKLKPSRKKCRSNLTWAMAKILGVTAYSIHLLVLCNIWPNDSFRISKSAIPWRLT